jgi:ABC-type dipeptide/oligopeptide/nickel transport system permease subunit
MIFGIIIGVALGYFFKPQLDHGIQRIVHKIREKRERDKYDRM